MNKSETNFKLDFIGIGFPRSGTTWLANNIAAHPEVDFAKHKETNFFLTKNSEVFSKESLLYLSQMRPPDFKTYLNEFTHNGDIKGEFGVYYIYDRYALNLLKRKFPDIKVLICIRNPVDCLESSYYFVRSSHIGYTLNDNYLEEVLNSPNQLYSIERAKYYEHVRFCKHLFGDKLKIILFEDIKSNPEKVLKDVYKFLGVTNLFFPENYGKKVNETLTMRNKSLMKVVHKIIYLIRRSPFNRVLYDFINKDSTVLRVYNKLMKKSGQREYFSTEAKEKLVNLLKKDIKKLDNIVDFDLSLWLKL